MNILTLDEKVKQAGELIEYEPMVELSSDNAPEKLKAYGEFIKSPIMSELDENFLCIYCTSSMLRCLVFGNKGVNDACCRAFR